MIVIGLTGSIGMGKSGAAKMLKRMGVPVFDSDVAVRHALTRDEAAIEEIALTFPESWDRKNARLDRGKLGAIVFDDARKRKKLESILHPIVQAGQKRFVAAMKRLGKKAVVLDIPLLFETGAEKRVDYTIVVTAPYSIQRRRVLRRVGMTQEKFEKILSHQMPDAEKQARADFVVQTGLGYALTQQELRKIVRGLLKNA